MAYPDDKETFRRVVNQELPDIPGDVLDQDDQNLPADFLERLQDTFGYGIKMGYASVKDFFNDIVTKIATIIPRFDNSVPYKWHKILGPYNPTITNGVIPSFEIAPGTPISAGDIIFMRISGYIKTNVAGGDILINTDYRITGQAWSTLYESVWIDNYKIHSDCSFSYTTDKITFTTGTSIKFRINGTNGSGSGYLKGLWIDIYIK